MRVKYQKSSKKWKKSSKNRKKSSFYGEQNASRLQIPLGGDFQKRVEKTS
jgi:hypothetical protein